MNDLIKALTALLKVKSIITIALLIVFAVLAIRGTVSAEQVVSVFMIIMGFYFGTQATKDNKGQFIELHPEDLEGFEGFEPEEEEEPATHAIGFAIDSDYTEEEDDDVEEAE